MWLTRGKKSEDIRGDCGGRSKGKIPTECRHNVVMLLHVSMNYVLSTANVLSIFMHIINAKCAQLNWLSHLINILVHTYLPYYGAIAVLQSF